MPQPSTNPLLPRMAEGRDIVVLGGSAGGLEALTAVVRGLEAEFPAALFAVIHGGAHVQSHLAAILRKVTPLNVRLAEDHEPIELGTIYVAPPDRHLLVKPGEVRVVRGPKENNFRPALDPLFRSAAHTYRARVIGVVLSGLLDDGSHGLYQIKQQGGLAVAQDPADAAEPSMPRSAIEQVGVDYVTPAIEIGPLLNDLIRHHGFQDSGPQPSDADVAEGVASGLQVTNHGNATALVCPECGGALWEQQEGQLVRYRCHVGHGFTAQTLAALQNVELEQALWTSVRLLEEQAELQTRLADRWQAPGNHSMRERFQSNADDRSHAANLIRSLLTGQHEMPPRPEESPAVRREYA